MALAPEDWWLGVFPLALDLANTLVVRTPSAERDLLMTDSDLDAWLAAEAERLPSAHAARGRLLDVRKLRDAIRSTLFAVVAGEPIPSDALSVVNGWSARCPVYPTLDQTGAARWVALRKDPFVAVCAAIARSAIDVARNQPAEELAVCGAPGCGMFFMRRSARQVWCRQACGNRARVARHARRARRPSS